MTNLGFIDKLALLGLKGGAQNGLTASEVRKALTPFLDRRNSDLLAALERLTANGQIEEIPHKKRQRSKRWRLSQSGNEAPQGRIGGRSAKQKAIRQLVAAHVLKLEPRAVEAIADGDGIFAYYLAGRVGEVFDENTTVSGLAGLVAARALNLSRGDPILAWERLIQSGLEVKEADDPIAAPDVPQSEPPSASESGRPVPLAHYESDPASIAAFAEQVKRAARTATDGWFGPRKLFIHRAWEAWKTNSEESADLPIFKQRLLQALRAGLLELSRADFPMGLESTDLQTALTHYGDETYHFITLDEVAQL